MARVATVEVLGVADSRACIARFGYAPRTVGIPLLPPDANEATWLAKRKEMLTASEVAAVFGRSTYDSPFSLWWRKQPGWPSTEVTANMHIGRKLEPVIGELFSEAHPEAALYRTGAALWGHHKHTWLGATPDYVAVLPAPDGQGVTFEPVECKSDEGGDGWGRALTAEIPFHHLCQVVTQALVLGVTRARVIRLASKRVTEYVVDLQEHTQLVDDIIHIGGSFVASLEAGITPEIDGHQATGKALETLHPNVIKGTEATIPDALADVYEEALGNVDAWKARLQDAKNRLLQHIGGASAQYGVRPDGRRVASRVTYKRNGYTVPPTEIDMIRKAK